MGYDGYKRKKGCKVYVAVDTPDRLLTLVVTPANEHLRSEICRRQFIDVRYKNFSKNLGAHFLLDQWMNSAKLRPTMTNTFLTQASLPLGVTSRTSSDMEHNQGALSYR